MNKLMKLSLASLVAVSALQVGAYPPDVIAIDNDTNIPLVIKVIGQEFKQAPGEDKGYKTNSRVFDGHKVKYCKIYTENGALIKAIEYETWEAYAPEVEIDGKKQRLVYDTFTMQTFKVSGFMDEFKKKEAEIAKRAKVLGYGKLSSKL